MAITIITLILIFLAICLGVFVLLRLAPFLFGILGKIFFVIGEILAGIVCVIMNGIDWISDKIEEKKKEKKERESDEIYMASQSLTELEEFRENIFMDPDDFNKIFYKQDVISKKDIDECKLALANEGKEVPTDEVPLFKMNVDEKLNLIKKMDKNLYIGKTGCEWYRDKNKRVYILNGRN